jgi:hypothetical protein
MGLARSEGSRQLSSDNVESENGGFALEIINLQPAVLSVIKLRSPLDELHPVAQHAADQSSQLGCGSLNCHGSAQLGTQSAKLRSDSYNHPTAVAVAPS